MINKYNWSKSVRHNHHHNKHYWRTLNTLLRDKAILKLISNLLIVAFCIIRMKSNINNCLKMTAERDNYFVYVHIYVMRIQVPRCVKTGLFSRGRGGGWFRRGSIIWAQVRIMGSKKMWMEMRVRYKSCTPPQ